MHYDDEKAFAKAVSAMGAVMECSHPDQLQRGEEAEAVLDGFAE
jgi:hypothetical protein